jgi:hypothetical protein
MDGDYGAQARGVIADRFPVVTSTSQRQSRQLLRG